MLGPAALVSAMTMREARNHPDWHAAWVQAAREMGLPDRGPRGSRENRERERLAPLLNVRALRILERGELLEVPDDSLGDNPEAVR